MRRNFQCGSVGVKVLALPPVDAGWLHWSVALHLLALVPVQMKKLTRIKVEIKQSPVDGVGCFAMGDMEVGEFAGEYVADTMPLKIAQLERNESDYVGEFPTKP